MHLSIKILALSFLIAAVTSANADDAPMKFYEDCLALMMKESVQFESLCLQEELAASRRLGVTYEGVGLKCLIGYGFDEDVRLAYKERRLQYVVAAETLDDRHLLMTVELPALNQKNRFYFEEGKFISPVRFFSKSWARKESKYFSFIIADSTLFHPAAIAELDNFVEKMARTLGLSDTDLRLLAQQKIFYFLCKDEAQIEKLTGYRTKGMYVMAYDYVVTTYSCHFHELLHLLVNFKLRRLPLFTHPILQEGVAVAFGGRGGIAAATQLQSGAYLVNSAFIDHREFFEVEKFRENDPSLTYPIAGLYVKFLTENLGMEKLLLLYQRYSSSADMVKRMTLRAQDFPPEKEWRDFVKTTLENPAITLSEPARAKMKTSNRDEASVEDAGEYYRFRMKRSFAMKPKSSVSWYSSKRFAELFPTGQYQGERLAIIADSNEIVLYDLYTNNSLASYSAGFSPTQQKVSEKKGWREFWVRKQAIPFPLTGMSVVDHSQRGTQ